jgi:hypothetical protein
MLRWILLVAAVGLCGCGDNAPPPPTENQKTAAPLPPEVEFDPATAVAKHKKHGQSR